MEELKTLEERVSDLENYVERLALMMGKIASYPRVPREYEKVRSYNPVKNTK